MSKLIVIEIVVYFYVIYFVIDVQLYRKYIEVTLNHPVKRRTSSIL